MIATEAKGLFVAQTTRSLCVSQWMHFSFVLNSTGLHDQQHMQQAVPAGLV